MYTHEGCREREGREKTTGRRLWEDTARAKELMENERVREEKAFETWDLRVQCGAKRCRDSSDLDTKDGNSMEEK